MEAAATTKGEKKLRKNPDVYCDFNTIDTHMLRNPNISDYLLW